ncbi:hypothetical protein CJ030_MR8G016256 [Morella rubra]|uniref:Uncharacterized protein n=1 Tax=Morella rubra TaxID=262757 RepID=A0A6A1UQJ2_9ROSI|nr:hypothetical protein CJ030_MR8G016256 [Morella rubra]
MCAPEKNESVLSPRNNEFAFYLDVLAASFRFPFPEKAKKVLKFLAIALCQLAPNGWHFLLEFICLWRGRFPEGWSDVSEVENPEVIYGAWGVPSFDGARGLSEEIKQSKQDLQVQIACCEHELDEAKKYKEECQRQDGLLLKNTLQISAAEALADRELQAHHDLIREFEAFKVQAKWEKDVLVTQFTHEKDALIAQAQRTIDTLQGSLIQVESTKSVLQDRVSNPEGSVTWLEGEGRKLRESLGLGEERIRFREDALINKEASSSSLEIIEKDKGSLRADPKGVGENAPGPALSPSSLPEVTGPKRPS